MSVVERIKAAATELSPDEQVELFRWWVESDTFKQRHLAASKREVTIGVEDLERGCYQTYTAANVMQLAEHVGRSGKEQLKDSCKKFGACNQDDVTGFIWLNALRMKVAAMVQRKK